MKHYILITILISIVFCSCTTKEKDGITELNVPVVNFNPVSGVIKGFPEEDFLKCYGINCYYSPTNSIYGYNYKTHAVDIASLTDSMCERSIPLEVHGPDGIVPSVYAMSVVHEDSIVIYDGVTLNIINSDGKVKRKINLPENEFSQIETNSRSHIAGFKIDTSGHTITYPVRKNSNYEIIIYNYHTDKIENCIQLHQPYNPGKYGFMKAPNISYVNNLLIYNYPFESELFIHNLSDDKLNIINPISNFMDDHAKPYRGQDIEDLTWYGIDNIFYTAMYYLRESQKYVRIGMAGTELSRDSGPEKGMHNRKMYVMIFNQDFTPTGEFQLPSHRYDPYAGWCVLPESIIFFHDNMNQPIDEDNIHIDVFGIKTDNTQDTN